jgi:transposase-like protein
VTFVALARDRTLDEITQHDKVHPAQIRQWKAEIQAQVKTLFDGRHGPMVAPPPEHCEPKLRHGKNRRLKIELDWLKKVSAEPTMTRRS